MLILPVVIAVLVVLPYFVPHYVVAFLMLLFIYVILAQSYDILGGYMGYVNLGQSMFFGVGAYIFGITLKMGFPVPLPFLFALGAAAAMAVAISFPFFRLRGFYFAIGTFALANLMFLIAYNLVITGGPHGLFIEMANRLTISYYAIICFLVIAIFINYKLERSKFGLALKSIREDEEVAQTFGINAFRFKCKALVLSSCLPGLAGAFYLWWTCYISPEMVFGIDVTLIPPTMAFLGGTGLVAGPLVGGVVLMFVEEVLWTKMAYLHRATLGFMLVLVGMFLVGGIMRSKRFIGIWGLLKKYVK